MKKPENPKTAFIADECVSDKTIRFLRSLGYKVETVWDLNLSSASDEKLIQRAINDKKVLITEDHDFCNLILYPLHLHHGIVVLKTSFKIEEKVCSVLKAALLELKTSDFEKTLIIIDKNRYRIRRKPAE